MSQHGALTKQQAEYVAMVSQGQNHTDIAKVLGVDRRTLIRWSKLPQVQAAIAESNAAATRGIAKNQEKQYEGIAKSAQLATTEIVERLLPAAVTVVGRILANSESRDGDRLKAAELITRWGGLEKAANQSQQTAEQIMNLYVSNLAQNNSTNP